VRGSRTLGSWGLAGTLAALAVVLGLAGLASFWLGVGAESSCPSSTASVATSPAPSFAWPPQPCPAGRRPGTIPMQAGVGGDPTAALGRPCRRVRYYAISIAQDSAGGARAIFVFANGAARGSFPLSSEEASVLAARDAYVSDVQLGSYEPADPINAHGRLVCRLNPTDHFYCPATRTIDELCYTWATRPNTNRSTP
jgi:hypothetical protein